MLRETEGSLFGPLQDYLRQQHISSLEEQLTYLGAFPPKPMLSRLPPYDL